MCLFVVIIVLSCITVYQGKDRLIIQLNCTFACKTNCFLHFISAKPLKLKCLC